MKMIKNATLLSTSQSEKTEEILSVLTAAGSNARLSLLKDWLEAGSIDDATTYILVFSNPSISQYQLFNLFDLGIPVLIVNCLGYAIPELATLQCEILEWPDEKEELTERLNKVAQQETPTTYSRIQIHAELNYLGMFGVSSAYTEMVNKIRRFAHSKAPVLVYGETGTGKELVSWALHYLGPREAEPFIPVNCGGLPDNLFENELFGHAKGAYTDAKESYSGLIEQAQGGTLFLDEIDSLSPRAQASLLRFLQDKSYRPLGGNTLQKGQVSIISASNVDLKEKVEAGLFREDLLYRINTIKLDIPPLRERPEDIVLLARLFLRRLSDQYDQAPRSFHPDSLDWMKCQHWHGNVRQLESFIHHEFLLCDSRVIKIKHSINNDASNEQSFVHLPSSVTKKHFNEMRDSVLYSFEHQYLHKLMLETQGNVTHAARMADKERRSLGKMLKKHGICREDYI